MRLVFISDTHNKHKKVTIPECDILFHTGDWTSRGQKHEVREFAKWLEKQPAKHIVIIPGNHEVEFEKNLPENLSWITDYCNRAKVLIHESCEVEGIKIWGSPATPAFGRGWAWNYARDIAESVHIFKPFIGEIWDKIPEDTEILLTHGPSYGILDSATNHSTGYLDSVGCNELRNKVDSLPNLRIAAAGHLHLLGGSREIIGNTTFINAAICNDQYEVFDHRKVIIDF